jgi:hypothetical protein
MKIFYNEQRTEDIIGIFNPVMSENAPWQGLKKSGKETAEDEEDPHIHEEI